MFLGMAMARNVLVSILIFFCAKSSFAQEPDSTLLQAGIAQKMYWGAVKSLAWYDIPIATVDLAELAFVSSTATNKPIKFPPTDFDKKFQAHLGVHGSHTIVGQVNEAGAAAFLGIRLLVNVGADLAGGNVTREDYHRTFWFYKSIVYTYSLTLLTKDIVYRLRPDGSDGQSFFSGHSSTAFCTASYLSLELNDWFNRWEKTRADDGLRSTLKIGSTVALYAGATYVAYSRMHDEKHYFSDVAVGATVGTVVGMWMYHWHWSGDRSYGEDLSFFVVHRTPTVLVTVRF